MRILNSLSLMGLILLPLVGIHAQNGFTVNMQIRPRAEFRNGQGQLLSQDQNPAFFISNRSRLTGTFLSEKVELKFGVQSVGVWGQQPQIETAGLLMMNEAWAKYKMSSTSSLTLGRMPLVYDDQRILGGLDWHVAGRFHDGLRFIYQKDKFELHAVGTYSANAETKYNTYYEPTGQPYRHLEFLWMKYQLTQPLNLTVLAMNTAFQGGDPSDPATWKLNNLQTLGANLVYKTESLNARLFYYSQLGELTSAYAAGGNVSYVMSNGFGLLGGGEFLSGNNMNSTSTTNFAFAPLYGTNHGHYGYMDYFYVGNHSGSVGLNDLYGGVTYKTASKLDMRLAGHVFSAMGAVVNGLGEEQSKSLGTELDFTFKYPVREGVSLSGGYSQMLASSSMEIIKGGDASKVQNWAWLMLNVQLDVLKH